MSLLRNRSFVCWKLEPFNLSKTSISDFGTSSSCRNEFQSTVKLSNGKQLVFSGGKYARMASGACVVQAGDTAVMATAVCKSQDTVSSFVPLTVNFKMKYAAAGRIPMNHFRRELGPSEREILTSRVIDRSIRSLFPPKFSSQVQIVSNLLSVDGVNDPEVLCINAASLALSLSDIPWNGPVGAVRVGMCNNEVIVNPTRQEQQDSCLNLIVTGKSSSKVVMLESSSENISVNDMMHAISVGLSETQVIINSMEQLIKKFGKPKQEYQVPKTNLDLLNNLERCLRDQLVQIFTNSSLDKQSRDKHVFDLLHKVWDEIFAKEDNSHKMSDIVQASEYVVKEVFRNLVFETNTRCDGRSLNDIRPVSCDVNLYKPLHGSAVFHRGQTQVLCTVALDSPQSAIKMDTYSVLTSGIKEKNFFLHYEFPQFATNDISSSGGLNRREIGHAALAEKGLRPVVPKDFPFCIRLTSEVLESNGSSSMATVCGGSLALLDAGIPLSDIVGGVAMGLLTNRDESGNISDYRILTDILGIEDFLGDMDFKIAGSKTGITALQADFKIEGIPLVVLQDALSKGHAAKAKIIGIMKQTLSQPRKKEENMPMMEIFEVPPHKRMKLTGPGNINLRRLYAETGVQITPLEDLRFSVFAPNETAMEEAYEIVRKLMEAETEPPLEFGAIYSVKIIEVRENGIMVTIHPKMMPVFIPNNQLDIRKVSHPSALGLEVGQKISVKYFGRDPAGGFVRLSRRILQGSSGLVHDFDKGTANQVPISREKIMSNIDEPRDN